VKDPSGGLASPYLSRPQHTTEPAAATAQLWEVPTLIDVKLPSGGEDCCSSLRPQQASVPSVFTAQVCDIPALTSE
jgi:hypothetical protein